MKNDIVKTFYHNDWCVMPFPRVNRTVLYNAKTKKVEFYKGLPKKQETQKGENLSVKERKVESETNIWRVHCMWLAVCLGATLAVLLTKYFSAQIF